MQALAEHHEDEDMGKRAAEWLEEEHGVCLVMRANRVITFQHGLYPPSLGRYVVHLFIRETRGNDWDPKWLEDALPHLAAHLPRVQSLGMERVTWEYLPPNRARLVSRHSSTREV